MSYLISTYAGWLLAALVLGLGVGWLTCRGLRHKIFGGWFALALLAFVIGLGVALAKLLAGRAGLYLETALLFFATYLVGCCFGCFFKRLFGGGGSGVSEPVKETVQAAKGKTIPHVAAAGAAAAAGAGALLSAAKSGADKVVDQTQNVSSGVTRTANELTATATSALDAAKAKAKATDVVDQAKADASAKVADATSAVASLKDEVEAFPSVVTGKIGETVEAAKAKAAEASASLSKVVSDTVDPVKAKLDVGVAGLAAAVPAAAGVVSSVVDSAKQTASDAVDASKAAASAAVDAAKAKVDDASATIAKAVGDVAAPLQTSLGSVATGVAAVVPATASVVSSVVDGAKQTAADTVDAAKQAASNAVDVATAKVDDASATINQVVGDVAAPLQTSLGSVAAGVAAAVPAATGVVSSVVDSAKQTASDTVDAAKQAASGSVDAAKAVVEDASATITKVAGDVAAPVQTSLGSVAAGVAAAIPAAAAVASAVGGSASASVDPKPLALAGPREGKADDLKLIEGIGPKNEQLLNGLGIYHFNQIADWSPETAKWVGQHLSFPGRIEREHWIPQARNLAFGFVTPYAAAVKAGAIVNDHTADEPLAEGAITKLAAALPEEAPKVADQETFAGTRPLGLLAPRNGVPDDLKLVHGIGPHNEGRLHGIGIWHFDQIAGWSPENILWTDSYLGYLGRIGDELWIEQCKLLGAGDMATFNERFPPPHNNPPKGGKGHKGKHRR